MDHCGINIIISNKASSFDKHDLRKLRIQYNMQADNHTKDKNKLVIISHFYNSIYSFARYYCTMSFLSCREKVGKNSCKTVTRVCTSFTEGHYYGRGERPNKELTDNSTFIYRSLRLVSISYNITFS